MFSQKFGRILIFNRELHNQCISFNKCMNSKKLLELQKQCNQGVQCSIFSSSERKEYTKNIVFPSSHKKTFRQHGLLGLHHNNGLLRNKKYIGTCQSVRYYSDLNQQLSRVEIQGIWRLLVDSPPVEFCQNSLIWLHSTSGLPWWATIVLTTLAARTFITLPCALYHQNVMTKISLLKYEMEDIVKDLKRQANYSVQENGMSAVDARRMYSKSIKEEWDKLIVRDNCHPMKGLVLALTQIPMWILLSAGLRNLCFMLPQPTPLAIQNYEAMSVEGFGWITNLTVADGYWILPVSLGVLNLINIEVLAMTSHTDPTRLQRILRNMVRGFSIIIIPVAGMVPSCLSLYWVTSSAFSLAQAFIVISPKVRRLFGIPCTETELEHPYKHFHKNLRKRLNLKTG